ncbi:hypothetical protein Lser_V15G22129 [Lactuca serriola]
MSSYMKMLRNKEFWFSFFVLGLLVIFVNGNNIGDKALKTTLIKTIWEMQGHNRLLWIMIILITMPS